MKKISEITLVCFSLILFVASNLHSQGIAQSEEVIQSEGVTKDKCSELNIEGSYTVTLKGDVPLSTAAFLPILTDLVDSTASGYKPDSVTLKLLFQAANTMANSALTNKRNIFFFSPIVTVTWKGGKCWLTQVSKCKFPVSSKNHSLIDSEIKSINENDFVLDVNGEEQYFRNDSRKN